MNLDHFVVHLDNNPSVLNDLKSQIEPLGFPFEPDYGKGTKGFKAANIWIGRQYFEIIRLLSKDGGGWVPHWVTQYNLGKRGLYCIFIKTENLDDVTHGLRERGLDFKGPERISFKAFFGLIKKVLPWRMIYTPPIPGTDLEIGFIQYDPDPKDRIKQYLVPNSDEKGISGISSGIVSIALKDEVVEFLTKLFPYGIMEKSRFVVPLDRGNLVFRDSQDAQIYLKADASPNLRGNSFSIGNVVVNT